MSHQESIPSSPIFTLSLTGPVYSSLNSCLNPNRASPSLRNNPLPSRSIEIRLNTSSSAYEVLRVSGHRLPTLIRVPLGTRAHSSLTSAFISSLTTGDLESKAADAYRQIQNLLITLSTACPVVEPNIFELGHNDLEVKARPAAIADTIPLCPTVIETPVTISEIRHYDEFITPRDLSITPIERKYTPSAEARLEMVGAPIIEVDGHTVTLHVDFRIHGSLPDAQIFIHWGPLQDLSSPWRDELITSRTCSISGNLEARHSLSVAHRGRYGFTFFAVSRHFRERLWLGAFEKADAHFQVHCNAELNHGDTPTHHVPRLSAVQRGVAQHLGSPRSLDSFLRKIQTRFPHAALGASLFEATDTLGAHARLFADYNSISSTAPVLKTALQNYGLGEIVFVSPEGPHAMAGGLAQVMTGLLPALSAAGIPATLISPLYANPRGRRHARDYDTVRSGIKMGDFSVRPRLIGEVSVSLGPTYYTGSSWLCKYPCSVPFKVYEARHELVRVLLLHNPAVFDTIYSQAFNDEQFRRALLLSRASLELIGRKSLAIRPSIIVSNDWMTGFISGIKRLDPRYQNTEVSRAKVVHIIHNGSPDYHGTFPVNIQGEDLWPQCNLFNEHFFGFVDPDNADTFNATCAAVLHADAVLTVSPTYAAQLISGDEGGPLKTILQRSATPLFGVSNGIRTEHIQRRILTTNQQTGSFIPDIHEVTTLKTARKVDVQQQLSLTSDSNAVMVSFIGRIAEQKGLDLLYSPLSHSSASLLYELLSGDERVQIVIAGPPATEDRSVERLLQELSRVKRVFGSRLGIVLDYIEHERALELMLASDLVIMPSRFEPGGITQLESLALGTPVVARGVGGLANTLTNFDQSTFSGNAHLCFEHSPRAFFETLTWGIQVQRNPAFRDAIMRNCLLASHDWGDRVPFYRALFQKLCLPRDVYEMLPEYPQNALLLQSATPA